VVSFYVLIKNSRRFVLFEKDEDYMKLIKEDVQTWVQNDIDKINWINTEVPEIKTPYLNF